MCVSILHVLDTNRAIPFITQAAESATAKRQPAGPRRAVGRPKVNHRGEDVSESSARIDDAVAAMNSVIDDPNPGAAAELLLGLDDTQPDTANAVPNTPTATAPLNRASTQVGMLCVAPPASPTVCSNLLYIHRSIGVVYGYLHGCPLPNIHIMSCVYNGYIDRGRQRGC